MLNLIEINAKFVHNNLAIRYFRARFEKRGLSYDHHTYTINQSAQHILLGLSKAKYQTYVFSAYIWNIDLILNVTHLLKSIRPESRIILGGPEVSFHDHDWLKQHPQIDLLLRHEGEGWFDQVTLNTLEPWPEGQSIVTVKPLEDLKSIGVPYTPIELKQFGLVYYESARGCPYQCTYCMSAKATKMRYKSLDQVKTELMVFIEAKTPVVKCVDRTFNAPIERAMEILAFLNDHDQGVTTFHFELSPNLITDDFIAYVKTLRKDLVQFEVGIQSTHERTLKAIKRHMPLSVLDKVRDLCVLDNCHTHLDLIAGLPFETLAQFENSFNQVLALKPDHLQVGMLKLLHGADLRDNHHHYGYQFDPKPPYEFLSVEDLDFADKTILIALEEAVERYHNSEKLTLTLSYLYKRVASPFVLYCDLGREILDQLIKGFSMRFEGLCELMLSYFENKADHQVDTKLLEGLMVLDFLNAGLKFPEKWKPYRIQLMGEWHDLIRSLQPQLPQRFSEMTTKQLIKQITVVHTNEAGKEVYWMKINQYPGLMKCIKIKGALHVDSKGFDLNQFNGL